MTLRRRLALLLVLVGAGTAGGVIGNALSGSALWFLAIPAALLVGWLWVADPTQCVPHDGGGGA